MEDQLYRVVAAGHPVAGADTKTVLQQLQVQLKLSPERAALLLAGKPVVIKKDLPQDTATRYYERLRALGLAARVEPMSSTAADTPETAAAHLTFGTIPQPAKPLRYWLALARCGGLTLAIGAGYFALVTIAIGALLVYAIAFAHLLRQPPIWWYGPLYLLPLLAGLALLPVLLRPLFVTRPQQPDLPGAPAACREFAAALGNAFGCAAPAVVELDAGATVIATPVSGRRGFWPGEYRLTLGLPLLQNLNRTQLAGQIAATLAPLSHPLTRGCLTLNQRIAQRCVRCAGEEDHLAQRLVTVGKDQRQPVIAMILPAAARVLAVSSRGFGKIAAWLERARTLAALELEADADRWQLAAAGSNEFAPALIARHKLSMAHADAVRHNREQIGGAGLVDNLPALVQHYVEQLDDDFAQRQRERWDADFSRTDATAGERERIRRAEEKSAPAMVTDDRPATTLVDDLETAQSRVTAALYATPPYRDAGTGRQPVARLMFDASETMARRQLAEQYFNGWFRRDRFWALPDHDLIKTMPVADAAAQLHVCVNEIRRLTPDRLQLLATSERLRLEIDALQLGQQLAAAGVRTEARPDYNTASALAERQQQMAEAANRLATQEAIMGGRIALALRLAGLAPSDSEDLHRCLRFLHGEQQRLERLGGDLRLLAQLRQRLRQHATERGPREIMIRLEQKVTDAAARLIEKMKNVPNPLDTPHLSMGEYVQAQLARQPGAGGTREQSLLESLHLLHEKLALLVAEHGSAAEAAYKTERIKLVDPERY